LVDWYLGTVGFSYKEWADVFYPSGLSPRQYLAYYSQIFNAVELDSTFYGVPPADRVRQWAASTPAAFKFCAKTPRQITHELRLVGAREAMLAFLETLSLLGEKLGAVLIQLPPSLTVAQVDIVAAFLAELPVNFQYAIEFRHPSWFTGETASLLNHHRICWVSTEYIDLPKHIERTTDFLYLRWLGRHGQYKLKDREQQDMTPHLDWWKTQLQPHLPLVQRVYGFFNNDYSGHSPATCNRFKRMLGLPAASPQPPQQGRLF
jgi:uncharacterized protein YecE (DUF72 family)